MATMIEETPIVAEVLDSRLAPKVEEQLEEALARKDRRTGWVWGVLRLGVGWIFLWAFLDKVFGLGFATTPDQAWLAGGSPTYGFLTFVTKGPLAGFYQGMAGNIVVDWLFMLGLLAVGLPLMLGIGVRLAGTFGVMMLLLMYTAGSILPEHNPFLDEHLVYAVILVGLIVTGAGRPLGLGGWWVETRVAKRFRFLL